MSSLSAPFISINTCYTPCITSGWLAGYNRGQEGFLCLHSTGQELDALFEPCLLWWQFVSLCLKHCHQVSCTSKADLKSKSLINHFNADLMSSSWQEDFCCGSFNKLFFIFYTGGKDWRNGFTQKNEEQWHFVRLIGDSIGLTVKHQMFWLL